MREDVVTDQLEVEQDEVGEFDLVLHRRRVVVDVGDAAAVVRLQVDVHHRLDFVPVAVSGKEQFNDVGLNCHC